MGTLVAKIRDVACTSPVGSFGKDDHYSRTSRPVVIELGAGTAIPSARHFGEELECPLIRINPSESDVGLHRDIAIPFGAKDALQAIFSVLHGAD